MLILCDACHSVEKVNLPMKKAMSRGFPTDRILAASEICNFKKERDSITEHVMNGHCVRLMGPRNFGKTSIVKNVVAPHWMSSPSKAPRLFIYADFYTVTSEREVSEIMTQAFNEAMSRHLSLFEKGLMALKSLKSLRPTWSPSSSGNELGTFSVETINKGEKIVPFQLMLETIGDLHREGRFSIFMALDEFQEISKVKGLEGKLRGSLQLLPSDLPVVVLGSKAHLISEIFESPRKPFYKWGFSVELGPIAFTDYHRYMNERFANKAIKISEETSVYLQERMKRVPESINRLCEYLLQNQSNATLKNDTIDRAISSITDESQSIYRHSYAMFSANEREILVAVAKLGIILEPTSRKTLAELPNISKSQTSAIFKKLANTGALGLRLNQHAQTEYLIEDAFFEEYLKKFHILR